MPCGQRKQKEIQRLAENWIYNAASGVWRVPEKRERRPLYTHARPGNEGHHNRQTQRDKPEHRLNGQLNRLPPDKNRVTIGQVRKMRALQGQE